MREIAAELKTPKLYGMSSAWGDLATSGQQPAMEDSRWLIEHLLDAETTDRVIRSIRYACASRLSASLPDLADSSKPASRL